MHSVSQKVSICKDKFLNAIRYTSLFQLHANRFILFSALSYALLNLILNSISGILILSKHCKNVMNLPFCNHHLSNSIKIKRELLNVFFFFFLSFYIVCINYIIIHSFFAFYIVLYLIYRSKTRCTFPAYLQ